MVDEAAESKTSQAPSIADEAKDLKALCAAVVDAAGVGAGLWFNYLFVFLYLLIAVGSATYRDLFLENSVKLPFLNVDLPLVGFFILGRGACPRVGGGAPSRLRPLLSLRAANPEGVLECGAGS